MTLPAATALAPAAVDRYLLPAQTDGRTPDRYINTTPHTMLTASKTSFISNVCEEHISAQISEFHSAVLIVGILVGTPLAALRYVIYFRFVSDKRFTTMTPIATYRHRSTGSSVAAASQQTNAPAACWLRHVLDDGGRQDWRVIRVRGVGGGVCDADAPLRWVGELIDRVNRQQRRPCQSADVKHVGNSMQL